MLPFIQECTHQKHKNENIQDYNFAYGFVWVQYLVSNIKRGT
jgi:hypothetical protein